MNKITKSCKTLVHGRRALVVAEIRWQNAMGGNENPYFSVTGGVYYNFRRDLSPSICGGIHDIIGKIWRKSLKPLLKWHLCDKNGPIHYIANALFFAGYGEFSDRNFDKFKYHTIWPELSIADFDALCAAGPEKLTEILNARLPALLSAFRADIEKLGFSWDTP